MGSYTWKSFPAPNTANFQSTARDALETNKGNCQSIDNEITAARNGESSLLAKNQAQDTFINAIINGGGLNEDGNFQADPTTNYLTEATDLQNCTKTLDTQLKGAMDALSASAAGSGVVVSETDQTQGFIVGKIIGGNGITMAVNNPGGSETVTLTVDLNTTVRQAVEQAIVLQMVLGNI